MTPQITAAATRAARRAVVERWSERARASAGVDDHLVTVAAPISMEAEQYRALGQTVMRDRRTGEALVLAVTSARPDEGKTTTASNLACAIAQGPEARVLLIDADLRRPSVAGMFGFSDRGRPGLSDWILDDSVAWETVAPGLPSLPSLAVMTAGGTAGDAYALLQSPRFGVLFDAARARFDCVIVDTPPILPVPDGRLIAPLVDAVLLVVAAHETPRALVEAALDATEPEKLAGIVFNGDAGPLSEYRHYYSPYYASPSAKADRHAR